MMPTMSADSIIVQQSEAPVDDLAGYDGDHTIDSAGDDESDDDDAIFITNRTKQQPNRSNSISNAELARSNVVSELKHRRRSTRSGSNGTVKKIPPPEELGDERTPAF